ncbi:MAG: glycerophosphodiester phosphodiesterase [Bacilli bacterium]
MKRILGLTIMTLSLAYLIFDIDIITKPHSERHLGSSNNIVSHRGFSSLAYENSLESIKLAKESECVDVVEIDVRLTKDNVLVLSHNNSLFINSEDKIKVSDISYKEFRKIRLNQKITQIGKQKQDIKIEIQEATPAILSKILKITKTKTLVIDIKYNNNEDALNKKLLKTIKGFDNLILQSKNNNALKKLKEVAPNYKYQLVIDEPSDFFNLMPGLYGVAIRYNLINYSTMVGLNNLNLKVFIWTINDIETYSNITKELKELSHKPYYVTDYPDILCSYNILKFKEL